jgi:aryl-alcohol dehydrogenase-like predicted oxidoreductase
VDLFQLHWPDPATPFEDTAQAMEDFVKEGKVRYVGVSNFDSSQMAAFAATRQIDAIQPPYHLFRRDIEKTILPYALRHHIGVLIYGPLAHGLLSGKYTPQTVFRADDWRSKSALFQGDVLRRNVRVVRELEQFALRREFPVAQLAIDCGSPHRGPDRTDGRGIRHSSRDGRPGRN